MTAVPILNCDKYPVWTWLPASLTDIFPEAPTTISEIKSGLYCVPIREPSALVPKRTKSSNSSSSLPFERFNEYTLAVCSTLTTNAATVMMPGMLAKDADLLDYGVLYQRANLKYFEGKTPLLTLSEQWTAPAAKPAFEMFALEQYSEHEYEFLRRIHTTLTTDTVAEKDVKELFLSAHSDPPYDAGDLRYSALMLQCMSPWRTLVDYDYGTRRLWWNAPRLYPAGQARIDWCAAYTIAGAPLTEEQKLSALLGEPVEQLVRPEPSASQLRSTPQCTLTLDCNVLYKKLIDAASVDPECTAFLNLDTMLMLAPRGRVVVLAYPTAFVRGDKSEATDKKVAAYPVLMDRDDCGTLHVQLMVRNLSALRKLKIVFTLRTFVRNEGVPLLSNEKTVMQYLPECFWPRKQAIAQHATLFPVVNHQPTPPPTLHPDIERVWQTAAGFSKTYAKLTALAAVPLRFQEATDSKEFAVHRKMYLNGNHHCMMPADHYKILTKVVDTYVNMWSRLGEYLDRPADWVPADWKTADGLPRPPLSVSSRDLMTLVVLGSRGRYLFNCDPPYTFDELRARGGLRSLLTEDRLIALRDFARAHKLDIDLSGYRSICTLYNINTEPIRKLEK